MQVNYPSSKGNCGFDYIVIKTAHRSDDMSDYRQSMKKYIFTIYSNYMLVYPPSTGSAIPDT